MYPIQAADGSRAPRGRRPERRIGPSAPAARAPAPRGPPPPAAGGVGLLTLTQGLRDRANLAGLFLGCIEAKFCKQMCV